MTVILDDDIRMLVLDSLRKLSQHRRLSYSSHVLQAHFLCSGGNHLVGYVAIVFNSVNRRIGDTESSLRRHACLCCPFDARDNVSHVVQSAEYAGDIHTLRVLHLIHKLAHIVRYCVHAKRVQTAVEHVSLDADLIERLAESPHCIIRILACEKIDLLEGTAVCLDTGKASHIDDYRSYALQLVFTRLELPGRLPHVPV